MATVEERLITLYGQREALLDRIATAGTTPAEVSVSGSVAYTERTVLELQRALQEIETAIFRLENPTGSRRTLPRYV